MAYSYKKSEYGYLIHFGILGQKWGIRRFQNEDGSLTEEGKKRYYSSNDNELSEEGQKQFFEPNSTRLTKQGRRALDSSDEDLKKAIRSEQFGRNYGEKWLGSYNKAADVFNNSIDKINQKYGDNPSKDEKTYRAYIKDVNELWQKAYGDILLKDFGEHPISGKNWINAAVFYNTYANADDHIDDDMLRRWAKHALTDDISDRIVHSGVKGQKWGVRRYQNEDGTLTEEGKRHYGYYDRSNGTKDYKRLQKDAANDAKEYARAKAYYGEGAGTRRKQIKNLISERMKDEDYKKEFERMLNLQDMSKHQKAANRERKVQDAKNTVGKTARGIKNLMLGVGNATLGAVALYSVAKMTGADKMIAKYGKQAFGSAMNAVKSFASKIGPTVKKTRSYINPDGRINWGR